MLKLMTLTFQITSRRLLMEYSIKSHRRTWNNSLSLIFPQNKPTLGKNGFICFVKIAFIVCHVVYQNQEPRMVPEPGTKNGTETKNGTRTKNQERYQNQEPRTKNGTRTRNKELYSVPQGIYRESALDLV